jgi:hypothetical protein
LTALFALGAAPAAPLATLDRSSIDARASQSVLLTVSEFGRYAVTVESSQGVALQVLDRMAGAGQVNGVPGKQDGRLDLFLDRGQYKILTTAAGSGKGKAVLAAHAFRELQEAPAVLVEHRLEQARLGDFEQRSYWIEVKSKRTITLEAAGRHLADLRLWRDGNWLISAMPQVVQGQGRVDQPLRIARLSAELTPGLYLVTAYGGPGVAWTKASDAKPFYLRFGIPVLAPAMRQQFTMSEFGVDRYLVPEGPSYFRLELERAQAASLQVGEYREAEPFLVRGVATVIDKNSVPPVAELAGVSGQGFRVVTVSTEAGKSYVLQHFDARQQATFNATGPYWVSSIHAGDTDDAVGATAVITRQPRAGRESYLEDRVLDLGAQPQWHRRFNLLDRLSLFVKVPSTTTVTVTGSGTEASYRFEPFLLSRPAGYREPAWRASGSQFELDAGLHILRVDPRTRGILDLQLSTAGSSPQTAMSPASPAVTLAPLMLESETTYRMYLNEQPGVPAGMVLRALPIDLSQPLPVAQRAGEDLAVPVRLAERSTVLALDDTGQRLDIALEGGKAAKSLELDAGDFRLVIPSAARTQRYALLAAPVRLASSTPLPLLSQARLAGLPNFPLMVPGTPRFVELGRRASTVHRVRVDAPGLYQFESTGLLHTQGTVRTRLNPSLFDADQNGVGRNFLIQRYLREGDYQLSVSTRDQTSGPLGVQIARTEVIDGGVLREGEVARAQLPIARTVAYQFRIPKRSTYHLQTLGLGRNFEIRLEDADGWPIGAPVQSGDVTLPLEPGDYRLFVLPQTVEARVLTRLELVGEAPTFSGHGPHRLSLGAPVEHTWIEPSKGAARTPDQWLFDLPAPADLTISLNAEMEAQLLALPARSVVAALPAGKPWTGRLTAGRYVMEAVNSRTNSYVAYTVQVNSAQLLPGASRTVAVPATLPVSVGTDGMVELASFGSLDVRAKLLSPDGALLAQNDDREGDWNFLIAQRLPPGQYSLQVDSVDSKPGQATISMHVPVESLEKPLAVGAKVEFADTKVHVYPLQFAPESNVLVVSAQSRDGVGLALEGDRGNGWTNLGSIGSRQPNLVLPLPNGPTRFRAYRLRAWSIDRRALQVSLRSSAAVLPVHTEAQWAQGVAPAPVDPGLPGLRVAVVELSRPGVFQMAGDPAGLRWSDRETRTAGAATGPAASMAGKTLWLAVDGAQAAALQARRLQLPIGDEAALRLTLPAGQTATIDLAAPATKLALVRAQSQLGQPGVSLGANRDLRAMGLANGEAVAVAMPGESAPVRVWNASDPNAAFEFDVQQVTLQVAAGLVLPAGVRDSTLQPGSALPIKLSGVSQRVRLTLVPMMAAVFQKNGVLVSTHWSGAEPMHEAVVTDADHLWLLNAGAGIAQYSLETAPASVEAEPPLRPGGLLERNLSVAGRIRIPVDIATPVVQGGGPYVLRVRGDARALWLESSGRIVAGEDIVIRSSGVLVLNHQPGTLVAWLDAPRAAPVQGLQRLVDWFKGAQETVVKPPQSVALRGKQQLLSLKLDRATMLHVRSSTPVVAQFSANGQAPQTQVHLYGANVNLLAPAGQSRLLLRAVGSDSLSGSATLLSTEITALGEGEGPMLLLAPGDSRLFSFEVKKAQTLGIGVRASSDVVRAVLYDAGGTPVSEGVVQMPTLAPGRYYLSIDMPAASAPVRVRPVVIGLNRPEPGPPMDVVRRFVEAKGGDAMLFVPSAPAPVPEAPAAEIEEQEPEMPSEEKTN